MKYKQLLLMLLVLIGMGHAVEVRADDFTYNKSHFKCMIVGLDRVRFTLPTGNTYRTNDGVENGYVYVSVNGGPEECVFEWKCDNYSQVDDGCKIKAYKDGRYALIEKVQGGSKTFKNSDGWVSYKLDPNDDDSDHYTTTVDWQVPYEMRGKNLKITMWAHVNWGSGGDWHVPDAYSHYQLLEWDCPSAPDISITTYDPMLAYDRGHVNSSMISYSVTAKSITWIKLHYTDAVTGKETVTPLSNKDLSGFAYVPADRPLKNVYIEAKVVNTEGVEVQDPFTSDPQTCNMLHHPKDLAVAINTEGKAVLNWSVDLPTYQDCSDGDFFEIQRNLMGSTATDDSYWVTISMEIPFEQGKKDYTYTDEMLLDQFKGHKVAYRVRRSATSMWSWGPGSGYQLYQSPTILMLPRIENAKVQRAGAWTTENHPVQFSFEFGATTDSEGRVIVRSESDWEDVKSQYATVQEQASHSVIVIRNVDDYNFFVKTATQNKYINGVLCADLEVSKPIDTYAGNFDGLGHVLTYNVTVTTGYAAPFKNVEGGSIRNLVVSGTMSCSSFSGGLIGRVANSASTPLVIENCRVLSTLNLKTYGDTSSGGFIGIMQKGASVTIRDCAFQGSMIGNNCNSNGGFVGVALQNCILKFERCLFDPQELPKKFDGCRTFARADATADLTFDKCYFTSPFSLWNNEGKAYFVITNDYDWDTFCDMVRVANGSEVNAILDADINITRAVGMENGVPYYGIFDGNGHTITMNLTGTAGIAPFYWVKANTRIKNLHVDGKISGGQHVAGLIVSGSDAGYVYIDNVWVSANIVSTFTHAGGFVGHCGTNTNFIINNSLFNGTAISDAGQYFGAFIGWGNSPDNAISNCLENGTYAGFAHVGMNYKNGTAYGNINGNKNNYSCHNWSEMGSDGIVYSYITDGELKDKLGAQWQCTGNASATNRDVYPVLTTTPEVWKLIAGPQGNKFTTRQEVLADLGEGWENNGSNSVTVKIPVLGDYDNAIVWDPRARLQLRVNMHGEKGLTREIVDLSGNNDAIKKQKFTYDLTHKCVEYDFDFVVKKANSPMNIIGTLVNGVYPDTLVVNVDKTDQGDMANYKFMNLDTITVVNTVTRQSSVVITWTTKGGESDYYRVLRREHTTDADAEWTDTVATNLQQNFIEDKTALAWHTYDYMVESVLQCEGVHVTKSEPKIGKCKDTGLINGYVRMADGTAMAGVTVIIEPVDDMSKSLNPTYKVVTDEAGFFQKDGIKYQNEGEFSIYVESTSGLSYTGAGHIKFDESSNACYNFNFFQDNYVVYSGNVYYRNTSIPVPGVSFKLDGKVMHDANRNVIETDNQGAFTLSIPNGDHSVQAVKEGHFFADDGFLLNPDKKVEDRTKYTFNKNVSSVYIWDSTTVVLRGRVVGGDRQGSLPLGSSLSKNNLADSIRIVMQLEGDNTSWLIRLQNDETVHSVSYIVPFGDYNLQGNRTDTARVNITRHTITIYPDPKSGEYQLDLPPAKYKVVEVSGQGYATLFQQGKVGETIDLAFNVRGDTCEYSRIYHATPTLEVKQFNSNSENYFGVKKLQAADVVGNVSTVNTYYYKHLSVTDSVGVYSFGYPVFMAGSPYGFMLQACEKYYYNNNQKSTPDVVNLNGGKVTIKNFLIGTAENDLTRTINLDEQGGGSYVFTPQNTTFTLEGDNALKNVIFNMEYDGSYYDIKPFNGDVLKGYVMASKPKADGQKTIVSGTPQLFDILRDPPGSGSFSYIEEGSKLSYGYSAEFGASLGLSMKISKGTGLNWYAGAIFGNAATFAKNDGTFTQQSSSEAMSLDIVTNFGMTWNYNYNIDISERIQTRSGVKWVGSKADLFIGTTTNVVIRDAMAVRVIPDSMYQIVKLHEGGTFQTKNGDKVKVPVGTTKVLAQGIDNTGQPIYLVRDEVKEVLPAVQSTFAYSQHYIENELVPELFKIRNALFLPKETTIEYARALANKNGYASYISHKNPDEEDYGFDYTVVQPDEKNTNDSIESLNKEIHTWMGFLAKNEQEKLSVFPSDLVKRYDFDGGAASIQYSESFSTQESLSRYLRYPLISGIGNVAGMATGMLSAFFESFEKFFNRKGNSSIKTDEETIAHSDEDDATTVELKQVGYQMKFKFTPIATAKFTDKFSSSETHSKKVGFTLSSASKSSYTVDVYRTASVLSYDKTGNAFYKLTEQSLDYVRTGRVTPNALNYVPDTVKVYSNFVFRTIGGVTCQPYEDAQLTKWYLPGTIINVATVPADKPRIWIDEPVRSNVPMDQPARFKLHFANETDYPERATMLFNYYLSADCNPKGATVCVDGVPLNGSGANVILYPAVDSKTGKTNVFTKEIAVYPSDEFDYENLSICLVDPEDSKRVFTTNFSAHFIPSAGNVKVTVPSDHWVINTESPYDGKRKAWYMPVRIEGFNVNGRGFDHIELQYKLSTQGEKDWVSTCAYYADRELMAKASGVTDTIPANGIIVAPFYGEVDPVEQYYDLRAVIYARHAGGYLTASSPILSGIKDTRLPRLFGTPEPVDGILGIGDDIKISFSEPIAGNYLSKINNFEVLGTPISTDISTSTSLSFNKGTIAMSMGPRNLQGKDFTVDMMLNPSPDHGEMSVFSHYGNNQILSLGVTADRHLYAQLDDNKVVSDSVVVFNNQLKPVAWSFSHQHDNLSVNFFNGNALIGTATLPDVYKGNSNLYFGTDLVYDSDDTNYYGEMLEFRLWNRAMEGIELDQYMMKSLSGYENGLLDYYKFNEGEGDYSYDKAAGSNDCQLAGHAWKRPVGISAKLDGTTGVRLNAKQMSRTDQHDYTLMFWFNTNDHDGTLLSNGPAMKGQKNQINIGFDKSTLFVRSSGYQRNVADYVYSGWHHFAMTVSRNRNVANVYLDKKLIDTFAADSLSGIVGDYIDLGATYEDKVTPTKLIKGNIDEVGLFESVLPVNLINNYSTHTPLSTMSSLMFYLDFGSSERQDNNTMLLEPTGVSIKRYVDSQGNILARRDTLVVLDESMADRTSYAPMNSTANLDNLKYNFVTRDHELFIDLEEPDFMIEKTNVYVTVKEVPDMQGNLMGSPVTLNVYVYRNPIRWNVKKIETTVDYGRGTTLTATVKNMSGQTQNFDLSDLPVWITPSQTSGTIDALGEQTIKFEVSPYINIGNYQEQISLSGGNNMVEPLAINLKVRGEKPDWEVSNDIKKKNQMMIMVARVKIDDIVASSTEDVVGVFDDKDQVLGVANVEVDNTANANEALAFLNIYGYTNDDGTKPTLNFKFYQASSGKMFRLKPENNATYTFQKDVVVGTTKEPVVLMNSHTDLWYMTLKEGWNWVTFCVYPGLVNSVTVKDFFANPTKWEVGDVITTIEGSVSKQWTYRSEYKDAKKQELISHWDNENDLIEISPANMYRIFASSDKTVVFEGVESYYKSIQVKKGWNRIGYLSPINLPISQALSEYTDQASEGDVIKSQDEFAIATNTSSGLVWKGTLKFMEASKGYMMKRNGDESVIFSYPLYYSDNRYTGKTDASTSRSMRRVNTANTMNMVASVSGVEVEEGDLLVVYCGADRVSEASADEEGNYYLNIGRDTKEKETLTFCIERNGELMAMTDSRIVYEPNNVLGTPDKPTDINFLDLRQMPADGKWYNTAGVQLPGQPTRPGLYIFNGKVKLIK